MRATLSRRGFAARLLGAQGIVLAVTVVTAAAVAWVVGPPIFHDHLAQAGHALDAAGVDHVEQAYAAASYLSLGIALAVALGSAALASWWLAAKIRAPLADLTEAAGDMAKGNYRARVTAPGVATELDALAASFNDMAERLEHVEDTRRRLLSDLAHELRTPIATLSGYLDGVDDGMVAWTEQTRAVLAAQVRRLSRLATDLDEVSRAEEGRMVLQRNPIGVDSLLGGAVAAARESFDHKGVGLHGPDPQSTAFAGAAGAAQAGAAGAAYQGVVQVDRERMEQVLANVLGNALRHTPPGGTVRCETALGRDGVVLRVSDTGEGIAAEHLPHVFERFYRVDRARHRDGADDQGAGIGLTICKAIVEAHGGRIDVLSDGVGTGTTVTIRLPRTTSAWSTALSAEAIEAARGPADTNAEGRAASPVTRMKGRRVP